MSNKGKTFTHADLPRMTQLRIRNGQVGEDERKRIDQWLTDQTERNRIVAMDGGTPVIAEELTERLVRAHATTGANGETDADILVALRNLMRLTPEQRVFVLESFEVDGALVSPFDPPPSEAKPKKAKK